MCLSRTSVACKPFKGTKVACKLHTLKSFSFHHSWGIEPRELGQFIELLFSRVLLAIDDPCRESLDVSSRACSSKFHTPSIPFRIALHVVDILQCLLSEHLFLLKTMRAPKCAVHFGPYGSQLLRQVDLFRTGDGRNLRLNGRQINLTWQSQSRRP